ncbi:MAG: IS30 family transposase [Gammaproteobacteria bacterium]|nr:IS30 family transposase [Gammaproteobacteria bacterium]
MPGYLHLTRSERDQISDLNAQGLGVTAIARAIGRHPSTIGRELKRNAHADGTYRPVFAEGSYLYRRQRSAILEADTSLRGFVIDRLAEGWTPEQIAGWLGRGIEVGLRVISHESIYAFIFRAAQKADKLWRYLTRRKASRGRRARRSKDQTTGKTHISERSEAANTRDEAGHWEGDLVICKHNRPLLVLHERKTRLTIMTRLASKTAAETVTAITDILIQLDPRMRRSMTFDNGGEFAKHAILKDALNMATYFCDAYASWQKGGVENANGRIRRWLPRQTDLDELSDEDVQDVAMTINLTPRKCLGFRSPAEAFLNELGKTLTIRFNTNVALRA